MSPRSRIPLASRLLSLWLALAFAVGPAVPAASACAARNALGLPNGRACCCRVAGARASAPRSCCAALGAEAPRSGPRVEAKKCACSLRAPAPDDALPRTSETRRASADDGAALGGWISSGAQASASTPIAEVLAPLDAGALRAPTAHLGPSRPADSGGLLPLLI